MSIAAFPSLPTLTPGPWGDPCACSPLRRALSFVSHPQSSGPAVRVIKAVSPPSPVSSRTELIPFCENPAFFRLVPLDSTCFSTLLGDFLNLLKTSHLAQGLPPLRACHRPGWLVFTWSAPQEPWTTSPLVNFCPSQLQSPTDRFTKKTLWLPLTVSPPESKCPIQHSPLYLHPARVIMWIASLFPTSSLTP